MKTKILLSFFALLAVTAGAQCPDDNHPHLIDLGLPSGTKWACCNVGANKPDGWGDRYAWGETDKRSGAHDWSTYLYRGNEEPVCQDIGSNIAGTEYDAARLLGAKFKMPTKAQFEELLQYCTHERTSTSTSSGMTFTAANGASVYFPEAYLSIGSTIWTGGWYLCSDLASDGSSQIFVFGSNNEFGIKSNDRWNGYSVRAVEGSLSPDDILIDEEHFPDEVFRNYLLSHSSGADGVLTPRERNGMKSLDPMNRGISSLQGIEYFPNLETLYCNGNQLTSLDVSKFPALRHLSCYGNQLTSLDLSQNTALKYLSCYQNQLTSLDLSQNTALEYLMCYQNQLTSLVLTKNTALKELYCYENQLTSLDVSQNTALQYLYCYSNQLTTLDVSHNSELQYLYCHDNQLMSLDLSKNTALTKVHCYYNQIRGAKMDALVESLPTMEEGQYGYLYVFVEAAYEGNFLMKAQVDAAIGKGWYAAFWPEVNEDNLWYYYEGHSHELESVEPVAPGCETPGSAEYWKCTYKYCGMMFADENGEEEIDAPMEIPATGHIWGEWQVTRDAEPGSPGEMTMTCELDPSHQQTRPIYAVTVIGGTASVTQAAEGETVTVTADEDGGDFRQWNVVQGDVAIDETATIVTFDMPDNEVELEALFIQQAELSFEQDEFAADMSETFVAPELINPNALAVTYASSDESVATVDAATGEVTLVGEGDVVITATFEGDDAFYAGEASYTIHVTDTTGISTWGNDATLDGKPSYNLRGQRARSTEKGVIIRKGKKVLRK